jgi:protein phosphatase
MSPSPGRALEVPEGSLVVLVGASGSGKSTFAAKNFLATEVLSSDLCRALVSDDENEQTASSDAFDVLRFIARKRMNLGRLTVVDATSVRSEDRVHLVTLARLHGSTPVAIVFDLPEEICLERNRARPGRKVDPRVVRRQIADLEGGLPGICDEGFERVYILASSEDVDSAVVKRV